MKNSTIANPGKRKSISTRVRFEVFKRDSFTCQYCGKQAPDVVLEVDHIEPHSKGGKDIIMNFITSCKECNSGKSDKRLSDDSAIKKQQKQLAYLQEKRQQLSMMLKWRKQLDGIESQKTNGVIEYIESKISGYSLNESGKEGIKKHLRKYQVPEILDAVNIACRYLQYEEEILTKESVETFLTKIGGILCLKNKSPLEQKIAYVKGICKNRFNYYDPRQAAILLDDYLKSLRQYRYSDDDIIHDIDNELIPEVKSLNNWTQFRNLIAGWTDTVNIWIENNNTI